MEIDTGFAWDKTLGKRKTKKPSKMPCPVVTMVSNPPENKDPMMCRRQTMQEVVLCVSAACYP